MFTSVNEFNDKCTWYRKKGAVLISLSVRPTGNERDDEMFVNLLFLQRDFNDQCVCSPPHLLLMTKDSFITFS
jgi:hypothetical protein